ncbi:beta/gamma crystallin-related protein [Acrocarpospora catenulata]|uniref:beta/gamma crystallin-related protein n=1 Tax=Acrocarpospora catenulata TaxID=2836182 RepID=UPI001BD92619|nr:beta/gamma crystallin-related protein [Acrocarpospora catenulata]
MSWNVRRTGIAVILAGLTALPAALSATPAQASAGALWLGQHQNLRGSLWLYYDNNSNLKNESGDKASSVHNDTEDAWVLFEHDTYQGRRYCIRSGQLINDLHNPAWNFGDKISSVLRLNVPHCSGWPTFN